MEHETCRNALHAVLFAALVFAPRASCADEPKPPTDAAASSTAPSTPTFHAEVTDPVGDMVASPGVPNPPDLAHATVDVIGGSVTFAIQFAPFRTSKKRAQ